MESDMRGKDKRLVITLVLLSIYFYILLQIFRLM